MANSSGNSIEILNYGGVIKSILLPDIHGVKENIIAGYDNLESYLEDEFYLGATIGRFSNRIKNAKFCMDGDWYTLDSNDGPHNLHGGDVGFHQKVFDYRIQDDVLCLSLVSEDGEGGFPGTINFTMEFRWTDDDTLSIDYYVMSDRKTPINITNHSYFNLSGFKEGIENHTVWINSSRYLETDQHYIPSGQISMMSFKNEEWGKLNELMSERGQGFNSYFIFNEKSRNKLQASLYSSISGRRLRMYTTYPGIQFYTSDFLQTSSLGYHGKCYTPFDAVCLEAHYFPDYVNNEQFPQNFVEPSTEWYESIKYCFDLVKI